MDVFKADNTALKKEVADMKDNLDGMKTQLIANTSSLSIVSTNVVQVRIDVKSLLLK